MAAVPVECNPVVRLGPALVIVATVGLLSLLRAGLVKKLTVHRVVITEFPVSMALLTPQK